MRHRIGWIAIAIGIFSCSAEMTEEPPATEEVEVALSVDELDARVATCEVDDLVHDEMCDGPWAYSRWKTCSRRDPACGAQYCPRWRACRDWSHGGERVQRVVSTRFDAPMRCSSGRSARRINTNPGDPPPTRCVVDRAAVDAECRAAAARYVTNFRADVPTELRAQISASVTSTSYTTPRASCTITVNDLEPRSGYSEACGCAEATVYPSCVIAHPECGVRDEIVHSSPGLASDDVAAEDPYAALAARAPTCSTCDDLPVETVTQARAKLACLRATWDAMEPSTSAATAGSTARLVGDFVQVGDLVIKQDPPGTVPQPPVPPPVVTSGPGLGALDAAVRAQLLERLQLLDEMAGHRLPASERAWIEGVVDANVAPAPSCHEDGFELASTCTLDAASRRTLVRCERLAAPHVASARAALAVTECAALLRSLDGSNADVEATCDADALREHLVEVVTALAAGAANALGEEGASVDLPRAIHALDVWNVAAEQAFAMGALSVDGEPNDGELRGLRSELLRRFWQSAQARLRVLDALSGSSDVEDALGLATERGMSLDRAVVDALATSYVALPAVVLDGETVVSATTVDGGHVARGALLAELLGDALQALFERSGDLALFHDLAQTFRPSGVAPTATRVAERWGMLAALDDGATLASRAASAAYADDQWPATMARVAAAHAHFRASFSDLGMDGSIAQTAIADLDPALRPLATIVTEAAARHASFLATGQLEPAGARTLHAGVDAWERDQVAGDLQRRLTELASARATYEADLTATVQGLLDESTTVQRRARLLGEIEERSIAFEQMGADLMGLLGAQGAEDARLGTLAAAHAAMSDAFDEGRLLPVGDTLHWRLDGTSALATGEIRHAAEVVAAASRHVRLEPGQALAIQASGDWSPTCLMRTRRYWDPTTGALLEGHLAEGAEIGPEGFHLQRSSTGFTGEVHSDSQSVQGSASVGVAFEACAGSPGLVQSLTGGSVRACATASAGVTWSDVDTDTTQNGGEKRSSASFSSGFRLSGSPFPGLPAGALLVVETNVPVGAEPRVVLDVHPVRTGQNLLLVAQGESPQPVDLFFVTNDVRCDDADTTRDLQIDVRVMEGEAGVAAATVGAMQEVLDDMRTFAPTVVAQGRVLPQQLASLRSTAYAQLVARSSRALEAIPAPLLGLFEALVDRELVRIEREVAANDIERALQARLREIAVLSTELREVNRQGRLSALAPTWALRNLDGEGLRFHVASLTTFVRRFLFPVLELWYPDALELLRDDLVFRGQLDALRQAALDTRTVDLVGLVEAALGRVRSAYLAVSPGARDAATRPLVGVGLVRGTPSELSLSSLRKASATSAQTLWQAIETLQTGRVSLDPEEVYSLYGGVGGQLACTDAVPVIQRAALVVLRNGDEFLNQDYNYERRWLRGRASVAQPFVTEDGLVQYTLANQRWQEMQLPVLYARPSEPLEVFVQRAITSGANELPRGPAGLSPFSTFEIDFQGLAALRSRGRDGIQGSGDAVSEIVLVMQVDSRVTAAPLSWLAACDPSLSPEPLPGGDDEPLPGGDDEPLPGGDDEPLPGGDDEPLPGGDDEPLPGGDDEPFPGGDAPF